MGQKVHPTSFRLGVIKTWSSRWYANKRDFAKFLHEDIRIRRHVLKTFHQAAIAKVEVERASDKIRVNIFTARPGVIIGRKGADIDRLREELQTMTGNKEVHINIREIKNPSIEAQLIAENIALQLEKRIAFRRAMKKAMQQAIDSGAKGIKIQTKGRLAGSEIARAEGYLEGTVPLHTLRADIDYGFAESQTTYGKIGVKVLVYKGDIMTKKEPVRPAPAPEKETQETPDVAHA
ncbi:MAG: 30S ribosomal protein S3 [Candidatus Omnitrophica bacterium]|nr:30S ribosomal protein S3 [Candidatus Omnitrophota bacterium]